MRYSDETLDIQLPQDGREQVLLEIRVGDEEGMQYSEPLNCSDVTARVTLTGTGNQMVKVYFDGVLDQYQSQRVNFDK